MKFTRRSALKLGALGLTAAGIQYVTSRWLPDSAAADSRGAPEKAADKASSDIASAWFEELYDIVKAERTPPTQASRIYGIAAVALYEGVVEGTRNRRSLVGQLNGLTQMPRPKSDAIHWPAAANIALASTIRGLFPAISRASQEALDALEHSFADQFGEDLSRNRYDRSVAHGEAVAGAILDWAAGDGFAASNNCPYEPIGLPGGWKPTPPAFNPNPLQPCWGHLRPMALASVEECPPPGHPAFSTDPASAFHAAALEVRDTGLALTDEQKTIADYWSDGAGTTGTPPGHWIAIVSQISRNEELSLAESAEAYARVGIAVHDAFICCWHAKFVYNLQRPVTYINDNIDPGWRPYITTPNFPAYTSGHSTQSGAAATVLTDMFGERSFTDTTHTDHGLVPPHGPRTFASFDEAAAEAAVSRLYGGIHYTFDNEDGLSSGRCIGESILERVRFNGRRGRRGRDDDDHDED